MDVEQLDNPVIARFCYGLVESFSEEIIRDMRQQVAMAETDEQTLRLKRQYEGSVDFMSRLLAKIRAESERTKHAQIEVHID